MSALQGTAPKGAGGGFTPGPWRAVHNVEWSRVDITCDTRDGMVAICEVEVGFSEPFESEQHANAHLIAAAPTQHAQMARFLPVIERAEADPKLWARLTEGTGIATANAYRAALAKAGGES